MPGKTKQKLRIYQYFYSFIIFLAVLGLSHYLKYLLIQNEGLFLNQLNKKYLLSTYYVGNRHKYRNIKSEAMATTSTSK